MGNHDELMTNLVDRLVALRPTRERREREFALELYRLLATGVPVRREHLAGELDWPSREIDPMLHPWRHFIQYDDNRAVVGFGGLTILPTRHRLQVKEHSLYAWCALDALFIPEILGDSALVESSCAETGDTVRVTISSDGDTTAEPAETVVSFPLIDIAKMRDEIRANICDRVFFFRSLDAATAWTQRHEGTFILTLAQAVEVGRRKNAAQYGDMLAPGSSVTGLLVL